MYYVCIYICMYFCNWFKVDSFDVISDFFKARCRFIISDNIRVSYFEIDLRLGYFINDRIFSRKEFFEAFDESCTSALPPCSSNYHFVFNYVLIISQLNNNLPR